MKSITKLAAILTFLVTPSLFGAAYPLPGKTEVICKDCNGVNFSGQKNAGLPTVAYTSPIAKHVGRLVDSSSTKDVQNIGIRTIRAGKIRVSPTRVYVKMGGAIGIYSLDTFFTSKLPAGMKDVSAIAQVGPSRTKFNSPNELLTVWDAHVYAEGYGSSWPVTPDDKQDVLHDFDVDDRGIVYAAYATFGWGILQDSGETGGSLLPVVKTNAESAGLMVVVKGNSAYYVAVGDGAAPAHKIYNVTSPANPTLVATRNFGIRFWAKNETARRIAVIDDQSKLRVYDNETFAIGGAPLLGPLGAGNGRSFSDVTFDESGNLWAVEESNSYDARLHRFTPSGSSYTQSTHAIGEQFSAKAIPPLSQLVTAGGGFVAVAGSGLRGTDIVLFKVEGSNVRKIDLKNYFNKYYHAAPAGYANPPTDFSYVVSPFGLRLLKQANKLYLMYNAHGMGDVYELEAGDSLGASMRTNNFGSANPHSKATETGPFLGDVVKFVATSSNPSVSYQVSWDFGNPESGQNLAQTATGAEASHQFAGYTTTGAITAVKKVTATAVNDASLTDTVNVTLKVPVPRIGIAGTSTTITTAGPAFNVLLGDAFSDASDGSVESHFTNWIIDGGTPAPRLPSQTVPVGSVGTHTVTMGTSYGRYDSSTFTPSTSMYSPSVANVPYVVRPFLFTLGVVKTGANAVFSAVSPRVTPDTQVLTATQWTTVWTLKRGTATVQTQTDTGAIGVVPPFTVPTSGLQNNDVVTLEASVPAANLNAPADYAKFTDSMTLETPAPAITVEGCANANGPCKLTAGGTGISGATFAWSLTGPATITGTGNPFSPAITVPGAYTVSLTAVKGIFEGSATRALTVAAMLCGPPPTNEQMTLTHTCPGGDCDANEIVTFRTSVFGYSRQTCDVYTWNWGDSSPSGSGEGTSASPATHKYASDGTYTVRLTVTNNSPGAVPLVLTDSVTVGGSAPPPPPPPPSCSRPTGIIIEYSGPSGCGTSGSPCKAGQRVTFTAFKNNGDQLSLSCDTANWDFGDGSTGSGRSASKTYQNAGTYSVTVRVSSSGGSASPVTIAVPIAAADGGGGGSCSTAPTVDNLILDYRGGSCSSLNGALCQRGENIQFDVKTFGYTFQSCDKFEWNFGDGTATSTLKNPVHAFTGTAVSYRVSVRVYNTANPTGVTLTAEVPFDNAPIKETPVITLSGPVRVGKGVSVTFTANATVSATNWVWNFGDGNTKSDPGAKTSSTVTHTYTRTGTFAVSVSAKNAEDTTDRSTGTGILTNVVVSDTPLYRFLIPAASHADGQNGSKWRTDVQVYYPAPSPSAEPLTMTAEFNGTSTTLAINQATFIYEDFIGRLTTAANASGSVILTTQTRYKPQIWTRTYSVDPSGKTYGQFIPAIELNETTSGSVDGLADPTRYYLSGLRQDGRYRTNLGFINTNTADVIADVTAYDDLMTPLDRFAVTLAPFSLNQISLGQVKNVGSRPVSLEINVPAGKRLVAYASLIDGHSNDPIFISATGDTELASADYGVSITPGVGHVGAWRSDVTIFNPDDRNTVTFDLEYYDGSGFRRGLATNLTLGPLQAKNYEDLLRVSNLFSPQPPDGVGMLKLTTRSQQARYPLSFSRTYNDKGTGGTFGQGIGAFAASRANVKPGKPAIIPGVRSNGNYKTNIGLTNATANGLNVKVSLLDPNTGLVASEQAYSLVGYASVVGEYPFGTLTSGTLKVEITGGEGALWAFASVIDRNSEDPEYVPAAPLQ